MRRSIWYCEPSMVRAGTKSDFKFGYTTAVNLPKGTKLRFDMLSKGRAEIDWETPEADSRKKSNVIFAEVDGKTIVPDEVESEESYVPYFDFTLPEPIKSGETLTIVMGSRGAKSSGNQAQTIVQRRRPFHLYVDTKGKGNFDDPETFLMDVRGGPLAHIRVLAPSFVGKNKRFDVVVRFEDAFGNLTNYAPEGTLIELTHEHLRENLNWKLFVPETGFITLPNLYFNEVGNYTLTLTNLATKENYRSAPIRCLEEADRQLLWGAVHGESDRVDSTENVDHFLRHFRDEKAYNFFATSPFEDADETPNDLWKNTAAAVSEFNEDDRFTTFLGCQWQGQGGKEGVRQMLFSKENKAILRKKEAKNGSLKKIYAQFSPGELISVPCMSMSDECGFDFDSFDPDFERVVEIYSAWGCSERLEEEGNPMPIQSEDGDGMEEWPDGSIWDALIRGHRFGFVAGGLDDRGLYGDLYDSSQLQYTPGMTAIIAPTHSRDALMKGLFNRSCYATTGARMVMDFSLAGVPMGQEVATGEKPGLRVNRHIAGFVAGTSDLLKVELVRNNEVLHTWEPDGYHLDFEYDDMDKLEGIALEGRQYPFVFYYIRATQKDGHIAWASPIWVDIAEGPEFVKKKPKRKK